MAVGKSVIWRYSVAVVALVVIVVSCKLAMHIDLESKIQRALYVAYTSLTVAQ